MGGFASSFVGGGVAPSGTSSESSTAISLQTKLEKLEDFDKIFEVSKGDINPFLIQMSDGGTFTDMLTNETVTFEDSHWIKIVDILGDKAIVSFNGREYSISAEELFDKMQNGELSFYHIDMKDYAINPEMFKNLKGENPEEYKRLSNSLVEKYKFASGSDDIDNIIKSLSDSDFGAVLFASTLTSVVKYFYNDPELFEKLFGFSLFVKNSDGEMVINDTELFMDYFLWRNDKNTKLPDGKTGLLIYTDEKGVKHFDMVEAEKQKGNFTSDYLNEYLQSKSEYLSCITKKKGSSDSQTIISYKVPEQDASASSDTAVESTKTE